MPEQAADTSDNEAATGAGLGADGARRLRVLGVDPELRFAGGETQVLGLTLELLRCGHQAELACDPRGRLFEKASGAGVLCHPLPIRNAIDFSAAMRLRGLLSRRRYDVVHFHTSRAHSMAPFVRGYAKALVVTRRMDYRPNRIFAPYLYNRAVDGVAAISSRVADALADAGVERGHLTIIPSGVDCARFRPATAAERGAARARLGIEPAELALGAVGMLEERKGHRYLLEALAGLKRARAGAPRLVCLIAGEGSLRDQLLSLARELGIWGEVKFLGLVADPRAVLDALDVFVFPSLKEGLGVALLEATACGLAAVASRTGGVVDIVEEGRTGLLAPPGDARALMDAIARLAGDQPERSRFGGAARERTCERFSMEAMARRTVELYRACLAGHQHNKVGRG